MFPWPQGLLPPWTPANINRTTITNALASNDIIVYLSARQAGSNVPEETTTAVRVQRMDTSTHHLTPDGMSNYNTNDASPSWVDYTGSVKFRINMANDWISLGWGNSPGSSLYTQHYITLRGFELTGRRITGKGGHTMLEYLWVHGITFVGSTVQFQYATDGSCADYGCDTEITVRNIVAQRGYGEGIYISGDYFGSTDGCPRYDALWIRKQVQTTPS